MKNNWPFAEPGWWINAIYHYSGFNPPADAAELIESNASPYQKLAALNKCYDAQIMSISQNDMAENQARALLFEAKCLRKWRFTESDTTRRDRALEAQRGFVARNHVAESTSFFGCDPTIRWVMRQELARMLPEINQDGIHGRFGPGAVAEHLTHAKRFRRLAEWCSCKHWDLNVPIGHRDMNHVTARLCAVPKQFDKDRLITVEPCYASFVQQYARRVILESVHRGVLRHTCMDLGYTDGQAIQRRLAQKASLDRSLATLDLKDASDNITWDIVQDVFPIWVVDLLTVSRSVSFQWSGVGSPACDDAIVEKLSIFAGMGNATTFAIETLFFTAYVRAVARICGLKQPHVSVFGDDVICSTDTAMALLNYESAYFVINRSKSFYRSADRLRESCGIFAYNGKDITIPRIDGYSDDYEGRLGLCDLVKRLTKLGEEADLRFSALAYLIVEVGRHHGIPNYPHELMGFPSFHSWYNNYDAVPKVRRNHHTGDIEYKVRVRTPKTTFVSTAYNDSLTLGLFYGWFCGQVRTVLHRGTPCVPFPNGKWAHRWRWVRAERGFDTDVHSPAQASDGPLYGDTEGTLPSCWCPNVLAPMQV